MRRFIPPERQVVGLGGCNVCVRQSCSQFLDIRWETERRQAVLRVVCHGRNTTHWNSQY